MHAMVQGTKISVVPVNQWRGPDRSQILARCGELTPRCWRPCLRLEGEDRARVGPHNDQAEIRSEHRPSHDLAFNLSLPLPLLEIRWVSAVPVLLQRIQHPSLAVLRGEADIDPLPVNGGRAEYSSQFRISIGLEIPEQSGDLDLRSLEGAGSYRCLVHHHRVQRQHFALARANVEAGRGGSPVGGHRLLRCHRRPSVGWHSELRTCACRCHNQDGRQRGKAPELGETQRRRCCLLAIRENVDDSLQ